MIGSISQHLPVIVKYRFVEKEVEGLTVQDSFLLYGTWDLLSSYITCHRFARSVDHQETKVT
jgi:hypothetical protein